METDPYIPLTVLDFFNDSNDYENSNISGTYQNSTKKSTNGENDTELDYTALDTIPDTNLELESVIKVFLNEQNNIYGVIKWIGQNNIKPKKILVGVELDEVPKSCIVESSDGVYNTKRYFRCQHNKAVFVSPDQCKKDNRFTDAHLGTNGFGKHFSEHQNFGDVDCPAITGAVPPSNILSHNDLEKINGKMKGIQGNMNSCYLDATLFAMFAFTSVFDSLLFRPANQKDITEYEEVQTVLRDEIVNPLRQNHYVRADKVMKLRHLLDKLSNIKGLTSDEKDPEEFFNSLLCQILKADPFLKLNSGQDVFFYQLFVEKDERIQFPSVQDLFEQSFLATDIKLKEIPSCLIIQMPRYGKHYKMYPRILPTPELDITDILEDSPRQCGFCGNLAEFECRDCFETFPNNSKLENTSQCSTCRDRIHCHIKRQNHHPRKLQIPEEVLQLPNTYNPPRILMELFAVLCIKTSHYVAFVKTGTGITAPWCFFDSMAGREGDNTGFNVPEIIPLPELSKWLSDGAKSAEESNDNKLPELEKRLLNDAYICMYQSTDVMMYR